MPLGGSKDEHFSCFHSSCQLGVHGQFFFAAAMCVPISWMKLFFSDYLKSNLSHLMSDSIDVDYFIYTDKFFAENMCNVVAALLSRINLLERIHLESFQVANEKILSYFCI